MISCTRRTSTPYSSPARKKVARCSVASTALRSSRTGAAKKEMLCARAAGSAGGRGRGGLGARDGLDRGRRRPAASARARMSAARPEEGSGAAGAPGGRRRLRAGTPSAGPSRRVRRRRRPASCRARLPLSADGRGLVRHRGGAAAPAASGRACSAWRRCPRRAPPRRGSAPRGRRP